MSLYDIDYEDSKKLWKFAMETCELAEKYATARHTCAVATKELKLGLAKAYGEHRIDRKMAEDKAYLLLAEYNEEHRNHLRDMIEAEAQYKGIEKVLEARHSILSFNQSLLRMTPK